MAERSVFAELMFEICSLATPEQVVGSDPKVVKRNGLLARLGDGLLAELGGELALSKGFGTHFGELSPWVGVAPLGLGYRTANVAILFAAEGDRVRVALQGPLAPGHTFLEPTRAARDEVRKGLAGKSVSGNPLREGEFAVGTYKTRGPLRSAARAALWFEHPVGALPDDEALMIQLRELLSLLNEIPVELRTLPDPAGNDDDAPNDDEADDHRAESPAVLLAINPNADGRKGTSDAEWLATCQRVERGEEVKEIWRCHIGVSGGERFFMVQMGLNPGIVAAGTVVSPTLMHDGVRGVEIVFSHAFVRPPPGLGKPELQAVIPQKHMWKLQISGIGVASSDADWIDAQFASLGATAVGQQAWEHASVQKVKLLRPEPANLLLEGVPGTGKTWSVGEIVGKFAKAGHDVRGKGTHRFAITLHPATTYEDFVEGLRPGSGGNRPDRNETWKVAGGQLPRIAGDSGEDPPWFWLDPPGSHGGAFSVHDGFFLRACAEAVHFPFQEFVVLLDEFNRCNVPKVMGDLLTSVEASKRVRRDSTGVWQLRDPEAVIVSLPTSGRLFFVPENLTIVATMNSSDRSVGSLDAALRRRFATRRVWPRGFEAGVSPHAVADVVQSMRMDGLSAPAYGHFRAAVAGWATLNTALLANLGPDAMLGHSYLFDLAAALRGDRLYAISGESAVETCRRMWDDAVLPQLCEALDAVHGARLLDKECPERWLCDALAAANEMFLGEYALSAISGSRDIPVRRALVRTRNGEVPSVKSSELEGA